jgi:hypothetical protein
VNNAEITDTTRIEFLSTFGVDVSMCSTEIGGPVLVRWYRGQAVGETLRQAVDRAIVQASRDGTSAAALAGSSHE